MICGYCGSQVPAGNSGAAFSFEDCEHEPSTGLSGFPELKALHDMVRNQLHAIEFLEKTFSEEKSRIAVQFQEFISSNTKELEKDGRVLDDFERNFDSLRDISLKSSLAKHLKPNLQDYFDRKELARWTASCKQKLCTIQKKFVSLEEFIMKDMDKYYRAEIFKISNSVIPNNSMIDLHDMSYKTLENLGDRDKPESQGKIAALKHFYSDMNRNYSKYVRSVNLSITKTLSRFKEKVESNKLLLTDLIVEFKKDFRIIDVFQDFQETLEHCLEEMRRRSKYKAVYKRILMFLNEMANNENKRRVEFLNSFSAKIPSQIFPNVKHLVKRINTEKILESIDDDLLNTDMDDEIKKNFEAVEKLVLSNLN